jgi:hypothetical protein
MTSINRRDVQDMAQGPAIALPARTLDSKIKRFKINKSVQVRRAGLIDSTDLDNDHGLGSWAEHGSFDAISYLE